MTNEITPLEASEASKNRAYTERMQCVAAIARAARAEGCRAWVGEHNANDATWEQDWRGIVFIELPTGQVSWHMHDSHRPMFDFLPSGSEVSAPWDGHSTEEKYRRLAAWHAPGATP